MLEKTTCVYTSRSLFRQTSLQKMRESYILCLDDGVGSPKRVGMTTVLLQHFGAFFSLNAPTKRNKIFYTNSPLKNKSIR